MLSKVSLSGGAGGPIITRLGFIPSTEIDPLTGQATTDPAYFFYVKNASFGGSIHVMLNFPGMLGAGRRVLQGVRGRRASTSPPGPTTSGTASRSSCRTWRPRRLLQDPGAPARSGPSPTSASCSTRRSTRTPSTSCASPSTTPSSNPLNLEGEVVDPGGQHPAGDGHPADRARRAAAQRVRADHQRLRGHQHHVQGVGRRRPSAQLRPGGQLGKRANRRDHQRPVHRRARRQPDLVRA